MNNNKYYKQKYLKYKSKYLKLKYYNNHIINNMIGGKITVYKWHVDTIHGIIMYDDATNEKINKNYQVYDKDNYKNKLRIYYELKEGLGIGQYVQHLIDFTSMTIRDLNSNRTYKLIKNEVYDALPLNNL